MPPAPTTPVERRALLGAVALVGAVGAARSATAGADTARLGAGADAALHAARRLTYGATPELVHHVRKVGVSDWLDAQLGAAADPAGEALAQSFPTTMWPARLLTDSATTGSRDPVRDLQAATFSRAAWGERQVFELLVEFWSNHLAIDATAEEVRGRKVVDDREVIRPHALGRFADMLQASARSPAMLRYLDNASSRGRRPNENYARELLELHTVGVGARYSARDVRDAALVFTGWTVDEGTGAFTFRPEWHHTGPVRVLGWTSRNDDATQGKAVGTSLLTYLAEHPATANRIASKLVRRLVADTPPSSLVQSAARVYLESGTSTTPVVRHIVTSRAFADSAGRKTQRPVEWLAASIRGLGLQPEPTLGINAGGLLPHVLKQLGQLPFAWRLPDGYPDVESAWVSTGSVLARWNTAQSLVRGGVRGVQPWDVKAFLGQPMPSTVGELAARTSANILCAPPRSGLRDALVRSTGRKAGDRIAPETAQAMTPALAALVLSSPDMAVR